MARVRGRWATQREGQEMPSNGAKTVEVGDGYGL